MQLIYDCAMRECSQECDGTWLLCANEVLNQNNICELEFAQAMRNLLQNGRGKHRNIMIVGPAGCAKTFLLKPLRLIYKTFSNPANEKYAFVHAPEFEVMFLNDFRWSKETIPWRDLLLLLEGEPVHIPTPKNHYKDDVCIVKDTPIFATGKSVITYQGSYNTRDPVEDEMMAERWKVFKFTRQIPPKDQKEILPCPKCFAQMVLKK